MPDPTVVSESERVALRHAAVELHDEYEGIFGLETIERLLMSTAEEMAKRCTVYNQYRVVLFTRLAGERLQALAKSEGLTGQGLPGVLFLCVHNAGRSQMALGWFTKLAGSRAFAWSGGSEPTDSLNGTAVEAMAEVGIDISSGYSKPWTDEVLDAADVVITMGCGDACPLYPGKKYEDWDVQDPQGQTLEAVRAIRDQIGLRVIDLVSALEIAPDLSGLESWAPLRAVPS